MAMQAKHLGRLRCAVWITALLLAISVELPQCVAGPSFHVTVESSRLDTDNETTHDEADYHCPKCGHELDKPGFLASCWLCNVLFDVGAAFSAPFWTPMVACGDLPVESEYFAPDTRFARAPYARSSPCRRYGGWLQDLSYDDWKIPPRRSSVRLLMDYGERFDDIRHVGGAVEVDTRWRIAFDARAEWFAAALDEVTDDAFWLGDWNILYRFAENERCAFRTGFGMNWASDWECGKNIGFNFSYGADLFPRRPIVVSSTLDWGKLGHSGFFRFRCSIGLVWRRAEPYVGFEYLDLDTTQLTLLTVGTRFWY